MELLPVVTVTLLLGLGGLTACSDDIQNTTANDGTTASATEETGAAQEAEPGTGSSTKSETAEPEATNADVIAYCEVAATMARLQRAGKDFGDETAKLSELVSRISKASSDGDLTDADNTALGECSDQVDDVYQKSG